jgi:hypothetical protein
MVEKGYKATGWLGLILGARLYFNFHSEAVDTDGAFIQQMDAVVRELGGRGQPKARSAPRVSEGVPPAAASSRSLEPSPSPAPAPAPARTPVPALAPTLPWAPAPAPAAAAASASSFTPSMQLSSPTVAPQQRSTTDDASLVAVLLEREERMWHEMEAKTEKLRQEAKEEKAELRLEMQQQMEKMREEMKPTPAAEAISEQRLAVLQARIEALHASKLLSDDELYALEDMLADYLELKSSSMGVVTLEMVHVSESASKLLKLLGLSEGVVGNSMFARQARRKYV